MDMEDLRNKSAFLCDMDGVIYHGNRLLPGVKEFLQWLRNENKKFLFVTNSSDSSPKELQQKLARLGIDVEEDHFYTSALATGSFLKSQAPGGSAYVIGEAGLINAMYNAGFSMNDIDPDYVVVGESHSYNFDTLVKAVNLVMGGAKLIGTEPDVSGPIDGGIMPGAGALISPIELATGRKAYFIGKPNPLMMRHALKKLGARREETIIIGDRMDTDIIAGIESGIKTVLVLSGVTSETDISRFAFRPHYVLNGVCDIPVFNSK